MQDSLCAMHYPKYAMLMIQIVHDVKFLIV